MGNGSNAQENTYIIDSNLIGMNVTAHGGKIINAEIGQKTFVGFNSFLHGKAEARLAIGKNCIIMPHTIIDSFHPLNIPDNSLVWGYIANGPPAAGGLNHASARIVRTCDASPHGPGWP